MIKGQIVKVKLRDDWFVHGRVISVKLDGTAKVRFREGEIVIISEVWPEMVVDAFWSDGISQYGV